MAKLYYFNGRGLGEMVRLTLAAGGIQFTEEFVTEREQFLKLIEDGKLLFKQMPLLEIDGKQIVQSKAIVRYLGKKTGLQGKNDDEALLVDQFFEGGRDFMTPAMMIGISPEDEALATIKKTVLPKYLPIFEKIAAKNGTGYLVGNSLTLADLSLLEPLLVYVEYLGKGIFQDFPALQKFFDTTTGLPRISEYLNGPIRKPKNSPEIVDVVKKVLAWS
ncbi:unnamed protein product [Lymnaea stagnalis]|uniref:Glutathione transferase n=1 Tax=Lymnaea stagnalis TaxID=6523 RepID=A0AAV2HAP1_LYMST